MLLYSFVQFVDTFCPELKNGVQIDGKFDLKILLYITNIFAFISTAPIFRFFINIVLLDRDISCGILVKFIPNVHLYN